MKYEDFKQRMQKIADIRSASALMSWDQEVYMPKKSGGARARQIATLSSMAHEMFIDDDFGKLIMELAEDTSLGDAESINVKETLRDYEKSKKYPVEFIKKKSQTASEALQIWVKAREANDFKMFLPLLERTIDLNKEEADLLGYEGHPYNALLDNFERDATVAFLDTLFEDLKGELKPLLDQLAGAPQIDNSMMYKDYDVDKQWQFGLDLLKQMGYDFDYGRQDRSEHPFSISFSPEDVRVTTRVSPDNFTDMTWSCIHEGGHALYELGLPMEHYGLPLGDSISLGVHESQSRIWENNVGRSLEYWQCNFSKLQQLFPENLGGETVESFYRAVNKVEPSLIRVDADELTYHFHIIIRYEIEKGMMDGSIKVADVKDAWNAKYKEYMGIDVPDDKQGVLQDVHWSHGGVGYFPTYTLGSLYAAQFFAKAEQDIPGLRSRIAAGDMIALLDWLRDRVHQYGKRFTADQLCNHICGESLNAKYFIDYATKKYSDIYSLNLVAS